MGVHHKRLALWTRRQPNTRSRRSRREEKRREDREGREEKRREENEGNGSCQSLVMLKEWMLRDKPLVRSWLRTFWMPCGSLSCIQLGKSAAFCCDRCWVDVDVDVWDQSGRLIRSNPFGKKEIRSEGKREGLFGCDRGLDPRLASPSASSGRVGRRRDSSQRTRSPS